MARRDADGKRGGMLAKCRPSQPETIDGSAGLPTSMFACASKCERETKSCPVAWTISRSCAWNAGINPIMAGGNMKKLSRLVPLLGDVESGRGMAIVGRDV